jgi:hypothetical protein
MPGSATPASPIHQIRPEPVPKRPPLPDPTIPASARYQVRPVQWGDRERFEVRDTATDTTIAIRTTSRIADEDVMVLNLVGPNGLGRASVPRPKPPRSEPEPQPARQCGRCRQYFAADPLSDPTALEVWWLCEPCHDTLIGARANSRTARGHVGATERGVGTEAPDVAVG